MARAMRIIGGPLDGHTTAPRAQPFVWIAPLSSGGIRCFDEPGPGRLLHRKDGADLVYAGLTHMVCKGGREGSCICDLPQPKNAKGVCAECGQELIPA